MAWLEDLTAAVAARDALHASALLHEVRRQSIDLANVGRPDVSPEWLPLAAGIVDLLAERQGLKSPSWTATAGTLPAPFYPLAYALRLPRLRKQCELESPLAL